MKIIEAILKIIFLAILAGAGYFYGLQNASRAYMANRVHASITIMDAGAVLVLYDSTHTAVFQCGKSKTQQAAGWLETIHLMFPEESIVIPCRVQNGRTACQ